MEAMPKKYSDLQQIHDLLANGMRLSKTRQDMPLSNYVKLVREHEIALGDWIDGHLDDNRTEAGVKAFEILSSLWATFEKRGLHFTDWIKDWVTGLGPKGIVFG